MPPGRLAGPQPEIIIINTCTVSSKADQKSRRLIRKLLRDQGQSCVIVTGCYAQLDTNDIEQLADEHRHSPFPRLLVMGKGSCAAASKCPLLRLPSFLAQAIAEQPHKSLAEILANWMDSASEDSPFNFKPQEFTFHSRAYLKIQDGCDNSCSFCRVRLARGPSISLDAGEALAQLLVLESQGCAEAMVTGVNITQYRHGSLDLAGLLAFLLAGSSSIALRLASLEPEGIDEKLAAVLADPRIRPHFHLSVQSGSPSILQAMGRAYDLPALIKAVMLLKSAKEHPFLACDIIAGFPGETEHDFAQSLAFCETHAFAWIHAFPYSRRPGTAALALGNHVSEGQVKQRVKALTKLALQNRRRYAESWLGRELTAVIVRSSKQQLEAVADNYLKLVIKHTGTAPLPGSAIRCVLVELCEGGDGEKPDAIAEIKE